MYKSVRAWGAVGLCGGGLQMRISAFVDCDSESIVVRMPYEMIVEVLCTLSETEDKNELMKRVTIASKRSNKLSKLLRKEGLV